MANLNEPGTPAGDNGTPAANSTPGPGPRPPTPAELRLEALERENRRLRDEVHALWRTLRTIAPELAVSEEQMREEIAHAVPAEVLMAELEQDLGGRDAA